MAAKKPDLADVFTQSEEQYKAEDKLQETPEPVETEKDKPIPSRRGKRHIGIYVDNAVYKQLKIIGVEKEMTMQQIGVEALNAFFKVNDKPPIAK